MAVTNKQVLDTLGRLYRIAEAGEKGFATTAANANSKALKLFLKDLAQQRESFKNETLAEIRRLGGEYNPGHSLLGMIHRGRVAIFATMTIENENREKIILKEAAVGERYAARTYKSALAKDLPPETRAMVERQYAEVRKVIEQVNLLLGREGKQLLMHLYNDEQMVDSAVQSLRQSGVPAENIEKVTVDSEHDVYTGKGTTVLETTLSGAAGGTLWGTLIGVLAGLGAVQTSLPEQLAAGSVLGTWALVAIPTMILAALVGGGLGMVIGLGTSEGDRYVYQQSILHGEYLVKAVVDSARAADARRILDGVVEQSREAVAST